MRKKRLNRRTNFLFSFGLLLLFLITFGNSASGEEIKLTGESDLQGVIDKAQPGDQIFLEKGMYQGPIVITKSLELIGEEGAIIDGAGEGNVLTISADKVTLSGLLIQNSGKGLEESGVYLDGASYTNITNNEFQNVHYGIYIKNGEHNEISENMISSKEEHFSKRGNGIHIFKGNDNTIRNNKIWNVQDGVYHDFARNVHVIGNEVRDSRYGLHYMFSEDVTTEGNLVEGNITGLMIMDSARLSFQHNQVLRQFHYRGFGVLIYDSIDVVLEENEIIQNSVGVSFEKAINTEVARNIIAANQVGLEFRHNNKNNQFFENNFVSNIVSSTIGKEKLNLDNGVRGNYWDDYSSFDITGDGIGEEPYKAGSLYDNLLRLQPLWQFFFESPTIQMWSKAESMFPSLGSVEVYDYKPLVDPVELTFLNDEKETEQVGLALILALLFLGGSVLIIIKGRKYR